MRFCLGRLLEKESFPVEIFDVDVLSGVFFVTKTWNFYIRATRE
jgi:hypothetical protein